MTTDALTRDTSTLPLAAGGATCGSAAAPLLARLARLFRPRVGLSGGLSGAPHPLLPLLRAYHDQVTPVTPATPTTPATPVTPATPAKPDVQAELPHTPVTATAVGTVATVALASTAPPAAPPAALPDIDTLTQRITALPPLPEAMTAVLLALNRAQLSANRSIELIEHDPALAARLLRLANSAFYGVPGRVASIGDAVRMLGLRTVSGVLAAASVHNAIRIGSCPGFDFQAYWQHAIACALAARALAPIADLDADEAFLAGLMHDIGQLALAAFYPSHASAALAHAQANDLPPEHAEQAVLGIAHPQVGALLAAHWHFPAPVVRAIAHHHAPEPASNGQRLSLSGLVQVADAVAHALDLLADPNEAVPAIDSAVWQALALSQADAVRIFAEVAHGTHEISALLHQA